jgi:hypothetical protein
MGTRKREEGFEERRGQEGGCEEKEAQKREKEGGGEERAKRGGRGEEEEDEEGDEEEEERMRMPRGVGCGVGWGGVGWSVAGGVGGCTPVVDGGGRRGWGGLAQQYHLLERGRPLLILQSRHLR